MLATKGHTMTPEYHAGRYRRIFRIVICLVSMGFVFPSALMDAEDEKKAAIVKSQSQSN
jgi:hypothetical protein